MLRFALRSLRRSPGFTSAAIAALSLGIGATVALFAVLEGIVLRQLPYKNPGRLVVIGETNPKDKGSAARGTVLPLTMYDQWRAHSRTIESMAAWTNQAMVLSGAGEPQRFTTGQVTPTFFSTLGVRAELGRPFTDDEDRPGAPRVVAISHRLWATRFGSDPSIVGRTVRLDGEPTQVIGILPSGFNFPFDADMWTPLRSFWSSATGKPPAGLFLVVARIARGVDRASVEHDLTAQMRRMAEADSEYAGWRAATTPIAKWEVRADVERQLWIAFVAAASVLAVACANLASLLLARSADRQREIALRVALGACRMRIVRELLLESALLSLGGTFIGAAFAWSGVKLLALNAPTWLGGIGAVAIDGRVLGFSIALSLGTTIAFGLVPALRASRPDVRSVLANGGAGATGGLQGNRQRAVLVSAQLAFTVVLLTGAGLLVSSVERLAGIDPLFDASQLMTAQLRLSSVRYRSPAARRAFIRELHDRIAAIPGVTASSVSSGGPFSMASMAFIRAAESDSSRPPALAPELQVSPDFFRTLGVPLLAGQMLDDRDSVSVVVNQSMARALFGNANPLGKRVAAGSDINTIVGVVGDTRALSRRNESGHAAPQLFASYASSPMRFLTVLIRSPLPARQLASALSIAVRSIDPDLPIDEMMPEEQAIGRELHDPRIYATLLTLFAAIAATLAALGVYSLLAYTVARRTREIGIRMALGAAPRNVRALVLRQAVTYIAAGLAIGLAGAAATTRFLASQLFEVSPLDPRVLGGSACLLALLALLSAYLPARRAARVDPAIALRAE